MRGPLNELLKKVKPWLWTAECQESFEKIKKTLSSDLSLTHYDPTLDIIVESDAKLYGIGACILHKLPDCSRKSVAHASSSLLPAEKQYSKIGKEALGIIFAIKMFDRYLHRRWFILQTDNKPLITIFWSKKGLPVYTANRLLSWGMILLNYNFKIDFLTSKNICHADSLSRLIPQNTDVFEDSIIATLRTNLGNQKQCSQEKSSSFSINSFHGKQSSRKPSRLIRNISFLARKSFSRPTKTSLHSGKWAPSNKDLRTGLYCPGTKKHPHTPYEPAQEMPFELIWGITQKKPAKSRSTQYSIISISTRLKSLRKYDAREEK